MSQSTAAGGTSTVTFSDGKTLSIKNGTNGSNGTSAAWFTGTAVDGTASSKTVSVSGSKAGDMYLNTSNANVYIATAANTWKYVCNIKGATGTNGTTPTIKAAAGSHINTVGTPSVTASTSGTTTTFTFNNLKGEKGEDGSDASVTKANVEAVLTGKITSHTHDYAGTTHNQASNTINAMTGYSKASSASAISESDSLNTAIGKIEKALDSKGTLAENNTWTGNHQFKGEFIRVGSGSIEDFVMPNNDTIITPSYISVGNTDSYSYLTNYGLEVNNSDGMITYGSHGVHFIGGDEILFPDDDAYNYSDNGQVTLATREWVNENALTENGLSIQRAGQGTFNFGLPSYVEEGQTLTINLPSDSASGDYTLPTREGWNEWKYENFFLDGCLHISTNENDMAGCTATISTNPDQTDFIGVTLPAETGTLATQEWVNENSQEFIAPMVYAECTTAAATATKVATIVGNPNSGTFKLEKGVIAQVKFTNKNTVASSIKLQVGDTSAADIYYNGAAIKRDMIARTDYIYTFIYNGTQWVLQGYEPIIAAASASTSNTGTATASYYLLGSSTSPGTTAGARTTLSNELLAHNSVFVDSHCYLNAPGFKSNSDRRLKENIKEFSPQKSILDLPVVEFDYKDTKKHTIGCIAQDLQEICPEIVSENANGFLSIEESKLVYLLLDEVKKLRAEVDQLKKGE